MDSPRYLSTVILCLIVAIICSIDRTAMSVAILPMSEQYNWNGSVKGAVSSAFNVGHTVTNLLGGYLAASMPPKHVLTCGVIVWSLFTMLTPLAAAARWLPLLLLVRAIMGLGEGVAFPTMQAIMKGYVPLDKRSRSISLIYSGHQIGSILSLLVSPFILASHGISALFLIYGALGFVWLAAWDPSVPAHPPLHASLKAAAPLHLRDLPWASILVNKSFWAILVAHATFGISYNMYIAWLPLYYHNVFGVDVKQSSLLSVLPWLAMALGTNASGWAADALVNSKVLSPTKTRKLLQLVGTLGPASCLAYLGLMPDSQKPSVSQALALMTGAMGMLGFQAGGFASNHMDIASKLAPVLFGLTNACASMAGSVSVYAVGLILDWTGGSWSLVMQLVAGANFACMAIYLLLGSSEPQFD